MDSLQLIIYSAIGITAGSLILIRKYREYFQWGWCQSNKMLNEKVVIITGGNSGIGKETAKELAHRGAIVILACRNKDAALKAIDDIRQFTKNGDLIFVELDLSSFDSIKRCAENLLAKFTQIDVLVNNAGVYVPPEYLDKTVDGFETHFGVNYLGHFYLTHLLLDRIKQTEKSRIISVSSSLYKLGAIDFDNFRCEKGFHKTKARNPPYSASKLANILHTRELYKRLNGTSVGVYSLSPGFVYTSLFKHYSFPLWQKICFLPIAILFMKSCKQGAQTTLHCAISEELDNVPFGYFMDCKPAPLLPIATDDEISHRLWMTSISLIEKTTK